MESEQSSAGLQIRPALADDQQAIFTIIEACFQPPVARYLLRGLTAIGSAEPAPLLAVAVKNELVVGVIVGLATRDSLYVDVMAVSPDHQNRGIGRRLLSWMTAEAQVAGYSRVTLSCHAGEPIPQHLYLSAGFCVTETEPNAYLDGGAALHMECKLGESPRTI